MKSLAPFILADTGVAVLITVVVLVALAAAIVGGWMWAKRKGWI